MGAVQNIEKVMVIQTYIDESSWSRMEWLCDALADLKPRDELILLSVLSKFNPPRPTVSLHDAAAKFFGYKSEDQDHSPGSTKKLVEKELRRIKEEELLTNPAIIQLHNSFQVKNKVKVRAEIEAGSSRKVAAVRAAKRFRATWIILDREMKKEKQYFMDRLQCSIWSMKSNNTIVKLRGPINPDDENLVMYGGMIPSYSWEDLSPSPQRAQGTLSYKEMAQYSSNQHSDSQNSASTSNFRVTKRSPVKVHVSEKETLLTKNKPHSRVASSQTSSSRETKHSPVNAHVSKNEILLTEDKPNLVAVSPISPTTSDGHLVGVDGEREFENSVCSKCMNKRPKVRPHRDFTYDELYEATKGFSKENFLSEGGFGFVFKGKLKEGIKIAVKQHKPASLQGEKEFRSEVRVLSQARHQNLVMLLGSCTQGTHRLLVYEYVCNGSLEQLLSGESKVPLDWGMRVKIAIGAAEGLRYLHAHNIVHRDMRPSNILTTHDHEALLGDFGLAKAPQEDDTTVHSSEEGVVGTLGYVAPEYAESGRMSTKTDVYSFGVVLLQLITGKRTTDDIPEGKSLIGWAKPLLETKNYPALIDQKIIDSHDMFQLFWMVRAAEKCLKKDPQQRLTMEQILRYLNCNEESKTKKDPYSTGLNS